MKEVIIIILVFIITIFCGGVVFKKINTRVRLSDGIYDFLRWLAYQCGWKPELNYNLYLTYQESEMWVESLDSLLKQPYMVKYEPKEREGLLILGVEFFSFENSLESKNKQEKEKAIAFSLARFYRRQRNIMVDWRIFYFHVFIKSFSEIWIPLNKCGLDKIACMRSERRNK